MPHTNSITHSNSAFFSSAFNSSLLGPTAPDSVLNSDKPLATRFVVALASLILFLSLVVFAPQPVFAKSYTIKPVCIQAQINSDGSMQVTERRQYHFDGSFSYAYQYLEQEPDQAADPGRIEPYQFSDFSLAEITQGHVCDQQKSLSYQHYDLVSQSEDSQEQPGHFTVTTKDRQKYIKWFYQAEDQTKGFALSYQVENAVTFHQDTAELYWQFIGRDWEIDHRQVQIEVRLPQAVPDGQLQALPMGRLVVQSASLTSTQ